MLVAVHSLLNPHRNRFAANFAGNRQDKEKFCRSRWAHLGQEYVQIGVHAPLQNVAHPLRLLGAHILGKPAGLRTDLCHHKCHGSFRMSFPLEGWGDEVRQRKNRQGNEKNGTLPRNAADPDLTALSCHQLLADEQPQPETFTACRGRIRCLEQAFKNSLSHVWTDPTSRV